LASSRPLQQRLFLVARPRQLQLDEDCRGRKKNLPALAMRIAA